MLVFIYDSIDLGRVIFLSLSFLQTCKLNSLFSIGEDFDDEVIPTKRARVSCKFDDVTIVSGVHRRGEPHRGRRTRADVIEQTADVFSELQNTT